MRRFYIESRFCHYSMYWEDE